MSPRNEDFLFAQEAQRQGYVSEAQVEEGFQLQRRMVDELELDERLSVILVKRGWLADPQARRVYAQIDPKGRPDEISGYEIVEKIGRGAMGTVYKAIHTSLQRPVAIKILRSDLARETIHVARLKEEAKLLASLDHPNIVRALDAGEAAGFPFVVMEYVEGDSLKDRIARRGPLKEVDALKIVQQMADALERARRMGVVHRDVKPGNIILSRSGAPKLMDLGLAKGPVDVGLTQHGATVGTPQYISPEQAQDARRADTRSDIYSLGATLYAMLTGRPPFTGTSLAEVLSKVLYESPTPVRVLNRAVSPDAAYLVERMMLKDPSLRHRTPAEVAEDAAAILAGRSIIPAGFRGNWEAYLLRRRIRRWTRWGAAAVLATALLGGGTLLVVSHQRSLRTAAEARTAVREVLGSTEIGPSDSTGEIQQKLMAARHALELYRGLDGVDTKPLQQQIEVLAGEAAGLAHVEKDLAPQVEKLLGEHAFAAALDKVREGQEAISGDGPARQAADALQQRIRVASHEAFYRLAADASVTVFQDLDDARRRWERRRSVLATPFVADAEVVRARELADHGADALGKVAGRVRDVEERFSATSLAPRLASFDIAAVQTDLFARRKEAVAFAENEWGPLEDAGLGRARDVRRMVEARLARLDPVVDEAVEALVREVDEKVRQSAEAGKVDDALALLDRLESALRAGGYPLLAEKTAEERRALAERQRLELERAREDLSSILKDVRERARAGKADAIRALVAETLQTKETSWPFREAVEGLGRVADALDEVVGAALSGLERRGRVEDVRLRNGKTEKRWVVESVDPPTRTVSIATSKGAVEKRSLLDVDPALLLAWAAPADGDPPPRFEVVTRLMALGEEEPRDLRPHRDALDALAAAFDRAGWEGPLHDWAKAESDRSNTQQNARERDAVEQISTVDFYMIRREPEYARPALLRLLLPDDPLRYTDVFDQQRERLERDLETVNAQLANLKLADHVPGARIQDAGGGRTSVRFRFESGEELESFRRDPGRGVGAIERYTTERSVTPGTTTQRLHLLRGEEGIDRHAPLVFPSLFDPAAPIDVQFTLFTLKSPFFLAVDVDGLQVAILSADPTSTAWNARWRFPDDVPKLPDERRTPNVAWYGRGRGVAFHAGRGFGEPTDKKTWDWPDASGARNREEWPHSKDLGGRLFAFGADEVHRVKVSRERGRLSLFVDDHLVAREEKEPWARIGKQSDKDHRVRGGTGLIQIWTWTPQAIDDLEITGAVRDEYR